MVGAITVLVLVLVPVFVVMNPPYEHPALDGPGKPPEPLTWEEHVDKYGPDDPVMKEALKTGEVDDPDFRRKHKLPPYDEE